MLEDIKGSVYVVRKDQFGSSPLAHAIWSWICIYGLFWFPQPDLPLSSFVTSLDSPFELGPVHGLVQEELS